MEQRDERSTNERKVQDDNDLRQHEKSNDKHACSFHSSHAIECLRVRATDRLASLLQ